MGTVQKRVKEIVPDYVNGLKINMGSSKYVLFDYANSDLVLEGVSFVPGGTTTQVVDFTDLTPDFSSSNNHFLMAGTYGTPMTIADTGSTFVPLNVSLSSTGNVASAGNQVAAARLRVNVATNHQANTAVSCLQLRSDIGKNCYAATNISASINVSADIAMPTATMQSIFAQITGAGIITCPNNVNVLECRVFQTAPGAGVDNVAELAMNSTGCTITNVLLLKNYAGTVTNGLSIDGTMTKAIDISTTTQAIYANVTAVAAAGSLTGSALCVYAAGQAGQNDVGIVAYLDATAKGQSTGNWTYGAGIWLNIDSTFRHTVDPGGWGNHEQLTPLNVGVYAPTSVSTYIDDCDVIYGIKAEFVGDPGAVATNGCYFAALNVSQASATKRAIFFAHQNDAVGLTTAKSVAGGAMALACVNGTMYYVNVYTA